MKIRRRLVDVALLMMMLTLASCAKKYTKKDIIGTWVHTSKSGYETSYTFNEDGTMIKTTSTGPKEGTYKVTDEGLEIHIPLKTMSIDVTFPLRVNGNVMTIETLPGINHRM